MEAELTVLEITKSLLPYQCDILLGFDLFTLHFGYNATAELFTVDLYKEGELVCAGEPIIYGVQLWNDVWQADRYPNVSIIPLDPSDESNAVTYDNLGETVLLIVTGREVEADA